MIRLSCTAPRLPRFSTRSLALIAALLACVGCGGEQAPVSNANQLYIDAQAQLTAGNREEAIKLLTASIDAEPMTWSLFERAKLHEQLGNDQAALDDCKAALAIEPGDRDLEWLQSELKKPKAQRFKGSFAKPPSHNR
ncbi:hypothetical protein [Lacipirellula parvula]|uniref:Tetratricopeptide repeat protein n=1 Tax=Lacipirellula parvula TaxID=2650471 RepID=A0A5K7X7S7_9BACT|nr:hypothetical protein [Lacipirellula parvula]BBO30791.1 hypothetical protein PLANPX_0403 [Lacipirellula parvula]